MILSRTFLLRFIFAGAVLAQNFVNAFLAIPPTQLQRSFTSLPITKAKKQTCSTASSSHYNNYRSSKIFQSESSNSSSNRGIETTGPKNASTSNNEFSRTIRVSQWFNAGGGGSSGGNAASRKRRNNMDLSISATPEECTALATRFRLTNITSLSAELAVKPALGAGGGDVSSRGGRGGGKGGDRDCIEAVGTVCAQVTQTCVRTNEAFDVSLEFSFETVLRAMASSISVNIETTKEEPLSEGEFAALEAASKLLGNDSGKPRKKKGAQKNKHNGGSNKKGVRGGQSIDDMGMKQLSDILMEYEVTDEIIEDESCFCTDGIVDCGEIVAQMFRSKLDPYPKKPGSVSCV
mmetsp:Transcript_602/g.943  ORF Transcript_602/g.943 Transcript_602/m.943 type:complete len:349 (+) Transcript_602:3-1049(+)